MFSVNNSEKWKSVIKGIVTTVNEREIIVEGFTFYDINIFESEGNCVITPLCHCLIVLSICQ